MNKNTLFWKLPTLGVKYNVIVKNCRLSVAQILKILSVVYRLVQSNKYATKR